MSLLLALGVTAQPRAGSSSQYQRVPARQQLDLSFYAINLALLFAPAPFSQQNWPNPQRRRPDVLADWVVDTNQVLLQPGVNPARQYDWPNPQLARRAPDYIAGTNLGLLRPEVNPAKQYDWPNPRLGWRNQDWIAGTNLGLLRPDVSPFAQADWPNALRASWRLADWSQQGIRAVVVVQAPFAQYDWPNARAALNLTLASSNAHRTYPLVETPFGQDDWPNPVRATRLLADWTQQAIRAVIVQTPFGQDDWPNPRAALDLSRYQKFTDYYSIEILLPEGTQRNWPNPRGARAVNLAASNPNRLTSVTIVTATPFAQTDWANPRGPVRAAINLYGWVQAYSALNLPAIVNPPIRQNDWPNPPAVRDLSRYQKFADNLTFIVGAPFGQTNWPVTPAAQRTIHFYSWVQALTALNLPAPVAPPIAQYNWPNPRGAARSIDLYGWLQTLNALGLPALVNPPIRQYDWPNPRGPQHTDRLGWLGPLGARDIPEGPPPIVIQPGGASVPHTFSRKRWRELQMLIAAEMAAVAKAERLTKESKREPLLKAARAAAAAVDAAEAEGENARLDKLLVRNAETIRRAIRAATQVKLQREVASAIEQSHAIVARQNEDEEDEMIALLMMS